MRKCPFALLFIFWMFIKMVGASHKSHCNPPKRVYNLSGDVVIAGLIPVHAGSELRLNEPGIMWVEAMMFAIREINENRTLLPDLKLGFDIRDSCNKVDLALGAALDFMLSPRDDQSNSNGVEETVKRNFSAPCLCTNNTVPRVLAVVGGASSRISASVSPLFSTDNIPQISYSSTSPTLSDKTLYSSFLRTIPSDVYQAAAIADILAYFKWSYVSIVVSDDEYGRNGLVALRTRLKNINICIAVEGVFSTSNMKSHTDMIVQKLKQDNRSSVVVLWCERPQAIKFLKYATGQLFNVTWIGTESWGDNSKVKEQVDFEVIKGMLGVLPFLGEHKKFESYLKRLTPRTQNTDVNPWLKEYWAQKKFSKCGKVSSNCPDKELPTAAMLPPNKFANVMDAVYAIAYGLQSLKKANPKNFTINNNILGELLNHIRKVEFRGRSAKGIYKFSHSGDPVYGSYLIKNLQENGDSKQFVTIAQWDGERSKLEFEDGVTIQWNSGQTSPPLSRCSEVCQPGFSFVKSSKECCWSCVRCASGYFKNTIANTACSKCPTGFTSNFNRTECIEFEVDFLTWTSPMSITVLVFCFFGLILISFMIAVFRKYSRTAVVKASNRELSAVHLICHGLICLLPALFIGRPSDVTCVARSYIFSILFTVITSIMFLKTDRIVRIFNSKSRLTKRSRLLSNKVQFVMAFALACVPTAGTTIYILLKPLTVTTEQIDPDENKEVVFCGEQASMLHLLQLAYILLLALLCTYEAYNARRLPESFNEAKFIFFSMFGFVLMWVGYIPGYLDTVGSTKQFITCLFILMTNYTTLVLIYGPKLNIILFRPQANRHDAFRQATLNTCIQSVARLSPGNTPEIQRTRSISLPNAFQNVFVNLVGKARSSSDLTNDSNGSQEQIAHDSGPRGLEMGNITTSPLAHGQNSKRPSNP